MTIVQARRKGDKYAASQSGIDSMLANREEETEASDDFKRALKNLNPYDSPTVAQSVLEVAERQERRKEARRLREQGLTNAVNRQNRPATRNEIVNKLSRKFEVKA